MELEPFDEERIICSLCSSNNNKALIVTDPILDERICQNCGKVISDKPNARDKKSHSLARYDMGVATRIGSVNKDAHGHPLDSATSSRMGRLRMWDTRVYSDTSNHKNLQPAFNKLLNLKDKLMLSNEVVERISRIYKKAHEKRLVHGRTTSALITAATYGVLKEMGVPRTLDEICEISNIKRKELMKSYKQLVFQLDFKAPPIDSTKYIAKMANKANVSEKTKRRAIDIMHELAKSSIPAGRDPRCLAAAVLYLASRNTGEKVSQIQLAKTSSKSEVAIRRLVKEIKKQHSFELSMNNFSQ